MLTMTFLVLDSRNDLPKVAYSTALDVYVCMCFFFIFASIVQFAAVHFFTKYGTADPELLQHIADTDEDEDVDDDDDDDGDDDDGYPSYGVNHKGTRLQSSGLSGCLKTAWRCVMSTRRKRFNKNVRNSIGLNSVSKIDKVARILFPAAFSGLNIIYWMSYLR
ncbi:gamma-aminobutyric acid receptor subunit alpha-2-like [Aplysia californica]|uniref:Gamma-aminobutyric acid receptor subunit alpha-2-like n=1 Tax=Aplysia californica TaxID=6500 RepID=A0ABM0K1I3_APLCA|nr:gamma-aminobutyric acid receptor subunit alpha-2-like [Aplysia californica]